MTYKINIRPKALKFIEKQSKEQKLRIYKAIYNLPKGDVKKMVGCKNNYRLRVRRLPNNLWIESRWTYYSGYKS